MLSSSASSIRSILPTRCLNVARGTHSLESLGHEQNALGLTSRQVDRQTAKLLLYPQLLPKASP